MSETDKTESESEHNEEAQSGGSCSCGPVTPEARERAERITDLKIQALKRMEKIKYKIIIMSGKGGVGKSTVAANLALRLSMEGLRVGLMDVDITGPNIPKIMGLSKMGLEASEEGIIPVMVPPHLKVISMGFMTGDDKLPIIWRGPLKMTAIQQFVADVSWGELDYLIIDLPPGTGDEPLSVVQNIPDTDGIVIVSTPQELALLDSRKSLMFAQKVNIPVIGMIENMSTLKCPHCGKNIDMFKEGGAEKTAKEMEIPFLGRVPFDPDIVRDSDSGTPFILEHSKSEAAEAFQVIVDNIKKHLENKSKE
ncbi:MAG: Mrp/NBP35 family ATP-binding protein [Thermoplasmata archaeon]|nr:MAG: Mrp/NBP35 family ATP-binding protein [Thermoplasmata archaeon]